MRVLTKKTEVEFDLNELAILKAKCALQPNTERNASNASSYNRYKRNARLRVTKVQTEQGYSSLSRRPSTNNNGLDTRIIVTLSWESDIDPDEREHFEIELASFCKKYDDFEHPLSAEYLRNDVEFVVNTSPRYDNTLRKTFRLYFETEIERQEFLQLIELYIFTRRYRGSSLELVDFDDESAISTRTRSQL